MAIKRRKSPQQSPDPAPSEARAETLQRAIEDEIAAGRLRPGERLDEAALARRFAVSRTPVREALARLASDGLVEKRPRLGAVVASLSVQQLLQRFEVMAALEALCARLAARRMTLEERRALSAAHAACAEAAQSGDVDAYYDRNRRFHETLYAGAHNAYLQAETSRLRNRLSVYRRFQLHNYGRLRQSLTEHAAVVAAVLDGDAERAADAMQQHVAVQGDLFNDLVSSLPSGYLDSVPSHRQAAR